MTPKRKQRLLVVLFIVFGVSAAVGLTLFALNQNINLFYSPTQIAAGEAPVNTRIRAGGMVVDGSVKRDSESLFVRFDITDYDKTVTVEYTGILPDLFREGQGIVAQGSLNEQGVLQAVEVLAKHDENYMPPEVAEALEKAGKMPMPEGQEFNK
ncbi:cytochrome c maturation protein CcmE [Marinobacterium sediminicola]|uniref:Cytochrome c-type biogenesis protein CcmE n=1 Tax=Marinobacterium sediminicola TaxID=518898 RepID=A0ABY1RY73_9GAMM|nr:cytochrome c maturation protein CcmE [Marinobacterium sediminicola]ULG68741.1 cytochrome c maturation protein CcmE [Marinobacterium sediminicola]SMR73268.1 cytochrome c-type biogenesis protein CcmE [Marinobacterium sediminicola]